MNITYKWLLRFSLEIISRLDLETVLLESHDLTSGLKLQDFFLQNLQYNGYNPSIYIK